MWEQNTEAFNAITIFKKDTTKQKFEELLGKRSNQFLTSVMNIVAQNNMLKDAVPQSVYMAAVTSAALDLPINPNLGFAYIVPYKNNSTGVTEAQFQIGYKGMLQLALRSGQFKTIGATPIYKWQLVEANPLTGYTFDFTVPAEGTPIGYASYFKLLNWFEKTMYMTIKEMEEHAGKFSQTYRKKKGVWKDDFDAMAQKTVLKLLISKFAPMSIEMQKAVIADQAVINDENLDDVNYIDNKDLVGSTNTLSPELEKHWKETVADCKTLSELEECRKQNKPTDQNVLSIFKEREDELTK